MKEQELIEYIQNLNYQIEKLKVNMEKLENQIAEMQEEYHRCSRVIFPSTTKKETTT